MNTTKIPNHIAIIMDGNGRWAKEKGLLRTAGHREGIKRVREIIIAAAKSKVKFLTLFAFSAENWSRPRKEINALLGYLDRFLDNQIKDLIKNNIRLRVIGFDEPLPENIRKKIKQAQDQTQDNTGLTLVLALNYGSRQEIISAVKNIVAHALADKLKLDDINESVFSSFLFTADFPDPDLLIRTSGELRLSNFLLWQLSYTEFYFTKKYWPDFGEKDFRLAIREYSRRQRRFGNVDAK